MSDRVVVATGHKLLDNEIIRFILSAGMGFLVDVSGYYILYHNVFQDEFYSINGYMLKRDTLSLAISFFFGVLVNFLITKYLVFSKSKSSSSKQFFRFIGVAIVGFYANWGILKLMIHYFNMYPPVARPLAALSLFFASFFVHKFFSFSLSLRHHATSGDRE
jgi:putative flippase GtrA